MKYYRSFITLLGCAKPKLENSKDNMLYLEGQHKKYPIHLNDYDELRLNFLLISLLN